MYFAIEVRSRGEGKSHRAFGQKRVNHNGEEGKSMNGEGKSAFFTFLFNMKLFMGLRNFLAPESIQTCLTCFSTVISKIIH